MIIGVFDSGFGGLTVLKALIEKIPQHNYLYLGDNARCPYGNKSQRLIYQYSCEAVDFLFKKQADIIIVACNTASAQALKKIQQSYLPKKFPNKKVLGVLIPAAEAVCAENISHPRIGVIGTRATIQSNSYQREIKKLNPSARIFSLACPRLVPLVEKQQMGTKAASRILINYLRKIQEYKIRYLILGCTHYPILYQEIKNFLPKEIKIINPPGIVADKLKIYLRKHYKVGGENVSKKYLKIFTTGDPKLFRPFAKNFLGVKNLRIKKVVLPKLN